MAPLFGNPSRITVFGDLGDVRAHRWVDEEHDKVARMLHEAYLASLAEPDRRATPAWDKLDDDRVDSNRYQADHIESKLRAIGCRIAKNRDEVGGPFHSFTRDEIELMAVIEHNRWVAERTLAEWKPGPVENVEKRISPHLVEWGRLTEAVRDYDRRAVQLIPTVVDMQKHKILR
jgi:hypothetical protein